MKRYSVVFVCLLLAMFASTGTAAAQPKVEIDPPFGSASDIFSLTVIVENQAVASLSQPEFKNSKDFQIQRRGTATRREWINGRERYQVIFNFVVTPDPALSAGTYNLPDGDMLISGEVVDLPGPTLRITPDSQRTTSARNAQSGGLDFTQLVDNVRPFVGQQVQYRTEMVASRVVRTASVSEVELPGLLRETLGDFRQTERLVGRATRTSIVEALFPTRPGVYEIPERELTAEVQAQRFRPPLAGRRQVDPNDPDFFARMLQDDFPMFDSFSFVRKKLTAEAIHIDVQPLPDPRQAGLDHDVSGYVPVGKVEVMTELRGEKVQLGESVTMKIIISGNANLRPYELPEPTREVGKRFKIYAEKPELVSTPSARGVTFQKTFSLSFVPQIAGEITLPVYEIVHFDPSTGTYLSYKTPEKTIHVTPDATGRTTIVVEDTVPKVSELDNSAPPVEELPKDLAPQQPAAALSRPVAPISWSLYIILLALFPIGAILQLLGRIDLPKLIPEKSGIDVARRALLSADSLVGRYSAWRSYLGYYFDVSPASLSLETLPGLSQNAGLSDELGKRLISITKLLEQSVYGGIELSSSERQNLSGEITRITSELGRTPRPIFNRAIATALLAICLLPLTAASAADYASEVTAGNMSFKRGDFPAAKEFYLRSQNLFGESPELLLNLGNAHFRLNERGRALDALEQAAILSPRNSDIKKSLFWVLAQFPELSEPRRTHIEEIFRIPMNEVELQLASLAAWGLLLFLLSRATKKGGALTAANCVLCLALCLALGFQMHKRKIALDSAPALVLQEDAKVYAGPSEDSQIIALLPDGASASVQDKLPNWIRVSVQGGRSGWLKIQEAKQVHDG